MSERQWGTVREDYSDNGDAWNYFSHDHARSRGLSLDEDGLAGLFIPEARATMETMYEFTEPFVVDSSRFQRTFGLEPKPVEVGIEQTVRWYQNHN